MSAARDKILRFAKENEPGYGNTGPYDPETGFGLTEDEYIQTVKSLLDEYAHELAERIRAEAEHMGADEYGSYENVLEAADLIDTSKR